MARRGAEGEYHVYTDGACSNNGGYNGTPRAGIGVYWGPNHPMNVSEPLPGRQTNNRAEIQAATRALYQVREQGGRNVTVHTDSDFLVKSTTQWMGNWQQNGWKTSTGETVKNKADFQDLQRASEGLNVTWVKKGRTSSAYKALHSEVASALSSAAVALLQWKEWRALWMELAQLFLTCNQDRVPAHSGIPGNEAADRLANAAIGRR